MLKSGRAKAIAAADYHVPQDLHHGRYLSLRGLHLFNLPQNEAAMGVLLGCPGAVAAIKKIVDSDDTQTKQFVVYDSFATRRFTAFQSPADAVRCSRQLSPPTSVPLQRH